MGLDMSVGEIGHRIGSYGYFSRYRKEIFKFFHDQDLDKMEGFALPTSGEDTLGTDNSLRFKDLKSKELLPFINHSDCDGDLTPQECAECIPDLERYLEYLKKLENKEGTDYFIQTTEQLLEMFRHSVKINEPVSFH
jgi:hypothetical protein